MKILFATDGSPSADLARDVLLGFSLGAYDEVTALAVPIHSYIGVAFNGAGAFLADVADQETADARRIAEGTCERFRAKGIPAVARVDDGLAPETIIDVARAVAADLIVLGSRGLSRVAGAFLGSTARAVARHSPIPVLVVQERRTPPQRILVATDGSPDVEAAIRALAKLPLPGKVDVTLVTVMADRPALDLPDGGLADELRATLERQERENASEILARAKALLPSGTVPKLELERGRAADRILAAARAGGTDLIVLGARGNTLRGDRFFQGSTADRILENGHYDVLVARTPVRTRALEIERDKVAV